MSVVLAMLISLPAWSSSFLQFKGKEGYGLGGIRVAIEDKYDVGFTGHYYIGGRLSQENYYMGVGATIEDPGVYGVSGIQTRGDWFRVFMEVFHSTTISGVNETQVFIGSGVWFWGGSN